ncbi:MAG: hypothetical protein RBU37_17435 [Myxococcota bacterium]|nr:hypothetical protein [Myxococcota bacterium]
MGDGKPVEIADAVKGYLQEKQLPVGISAAITLFVLPSILLIREDVGKLSQRVATWFGATMKQQADDVPATSPNGQPRPSLPNIPVQEPS